MKEKETKKYKYVYIHKRKSNGKIFYVGCGTKQRVTSKHGRSKFWKKVVDEHGFTAKIVFKSENQEEAFEYETKLIEEYGLKRLGGKLINRAITVRTNYDQQKLYKQIIQYTMDDVFIREWDSIKEASETLNINQSTISKVCLNKYKSSGGFKWKYKEQ